MNPDFTDRATGLFTATNIQYMMPTHRNAFNYQERGFKQSLLTDKIQMKP
jgi:hypothetical protein